MATDKSQLHCGIVAINKPKGVTSHDIVNNIRRQFRGEKVGHAGTLDPLASGVLVVAIGREYTKQIRHIVEKDKEYIATIHLGITSPTDDAEGVSREQLDKFAQNQKNIQIPTQQEIHSAFAQFLGDIWQMPPAYSAVKIRGQEAYKRARRGEKFVMGARNIRIDSIELIAYQYPIATLRIVTGPGAYIRSLARDIGEALGTGAYLADLVRVRVGQYMLDDAISLVSLARKNENSTNK